MQMPLVIKSGRHKELAAAARDLVERFHENLLNKKMAKLESLREAQLWMLRERGALGFADLDDDEKTQKPKRLPPHNWAAFVLSGDWR